MAGIHIPMSVLAYIVETVYLNTFHVLPWKQNQNLPTFQLFKKRI